MMEQLIAGLPLWRDDYPAAMLLYATPCYTMLCCMMVQPYLACSSF